MTAGPSSSLRFVVAVLAAASLGLGAAVTSSAWGTWGTPFASLLVDPYGAFSSVYLPQWNNQRLPLRHPNPVIACDGDAIDVALARQGVFPGQQLQDCIQRAHDAGRAEVSLEFSQGSQPLTLRQPIRLFGAEEVLFLYGVYALVGAFLLWSGLLVLLLAGRRDGAVAYGVLCISGFVFLLTLFDYHTRAAYMPLFIASRLGTGIGLIWLGYAFPERPVRFRRLWRTALAALCAGALGVAAWLLVAPHAGLETAWMRARVNDFSQGSLLVCGLSILVRIRGSKGRQRAELLSAAWGLALLPVLVAFFVFFGRGLYLMVPCLIATLPLSIGHGLIRQNVLEVTAVLTRRLMAVPLVLAGLLAAAFTWRGMSQLLATYGVPDVLPGVAAVSVFVVLVLLGKPWVDRLFFPATLQFRPTVEQLSDELAAPRDPGAIRDTVERVILRWLSTGRVQVLDTAELSAVSHLPEDARARLGAGAHLWTQEDAWQRKLLVPMRSLGELRGVLLLAPKEQQALYTSEDLELLHTIASLAGVALHNTQVLRELEQLRQAQVDAAHEEKRLALALLSAEISHEMAYPLNFFRHLLRQGGKGKSLDGEDIDIGQEEIERLERMLISLRRLSLPPPKLEPVLVLPRVRRALDLIRDQMQEARVVASVDVAPELTLLAEPDAMVQLFANLLRNAAQAAGPAGHIGVRAREESTERVLEVWDSGPGVPESARDTLFDPWVTTRQGGLGLGLAVTQRIVRRFGWSISVHREDDRTCFRVHTPLDGSIKAPTTQEVA
ncbi:sensor histidine kinase [Myxococcus sp. AM011]|uniref:sensor histidine kinase n=1 Tax=Myxococcus sp. AM011 TaxID=2745200 RepID=UPI0015962672|nr:ATP-binding protein [Myxococcus sp. AM011]NVJ25525.1 sensor histidine kinase [Myxococcus sp. AM011]